MVCGRSKPAERYGFIGLDNPDFRQSPLFLQLLRLIGGHLGCARENLRMLSLLEQEQKTLKKALAEANLNNEIISAISKIYYAIYRIDLDKDIYEEVSSDNEVHRLTGRRGRASTRMVELCDNFVADEYREKVKEFLDISTLAERLKEDETIAVEYLALDGNWHLARFIVKKRAADGRVTHVLYVTRVISIEKRREQYWIVAAEKEITLELPYCEEERGGDGQKTENQKTDGKEEHAKDLHLLLAEDNDLNYEIEAELLRMHGITCDRAENGQICVEKFNRASAGTYQAILMDMQMPVMNGIEASERIRELSHPDARTVPIIATTANAFKEDMERCLGAGMNDHMSKPLDIHKLIEMIEKYQTEKTK